MAEWNRIQRFSVTTNVVLHVNASTSSSKIQFVIIKLWMGPNWLIYPILSPILSKSNAENAKNRDFLGADQSDQAFRGIFWGPDFPLSDTGN